jgi:APA family basic amino acid/polyamine antiporter
VHEPARYVGLGWMTAGLALYVIYRRAGLAIVDEARRRGVEAVVLGAEEPSLIRGGARLGGRGGQLENFVGEVTKYVINKAPCRVILTAPVAKADGKNDQADATLAARQA